MELHIWIKLFGLVADQGKDAVGLNKGLIGRIQRSLSITLFHVEGDLHVVNLMLVNACHAVFGKPKQDKLSVFQRFIWSPPVVVPEKSDKEFFSATVSLLHPSSQFPSRQGGTLWWELPNSHRKTPSS